MHVLESFVAAAGAADAGDRSRLEREIVQLRKVRVSTSIPTAGGWIWMHACMSERIGAELSVA